MNFELKITGLYEAGLWANKPWPTHIISIINPNVQLPFSCENHLILEFHDVESHIDGHTLPGMRHIEQILEFSKSFVDGDRILIHCHQGVSRSTAAALGILIQHGFDIDSAYIYIESIRDVLLPNGLMIKYFDNYFNFNGELHNLVIEKRKEQFKKQSEISAKFASGDFNKHENLVEMKSILEKLGQIGILV